MTTRTRLGRWALVALAAVATAAGVAPHVTHGVPRRMEQAVSSVPQVLSGAQHSGRHALVGARVHPPATFAAAPAVTASAAVAFLVFAVVLGATRVRHSRAGLVAASRGPPVHRSSHAS